MARLDFTACFFWYRPIRDASRPRTSIARATWLDVSGLSASSRYWTGMNWWILEIYYKLIQIIKVFTLYMSHIKNMKAGLQSNFMYLYWVGLTAYRLEALTPCKKNVILKIELITQHMILHDMSSLGFSSHRYNFCTCWTWFRFAPAPFHPTTRIFRLRSASCSNTSCKTRACCKLEENKHEKQNRDLWRSED